MRVRAQVVLFILAILTTSCKDFVYVGDAKVEVESPECVACVTRDLTFPGYFREVQDPADLQIVSDSLLVIQDHASTMDPKELCFKVYSCRTFEYLGSFVRVGRGPNEVLSPEIAHVGPGEDFLYIIDRERVFWLDVPNIMSGQTEALTIDGRLPKDTFLGFVMPGVGTLALKVEKNEMVVHVLDSEGEGVMMLHPYAGIRIDFTQTKMSSLAVTDRESGKAAVFMVCLPMMTLLDTKKGTAWSYASDRSIRNWHSVLKAPFGPSSIQYYSGAACGGGLLLALYNGCSIAELAGNNVGGHIHIFDWTGRFLYDLCVQEDIWRLAYDSLSHALYGLERSTGKIIRYDLTDILAR